MIIIVYMSHLFVLSMSSVGYLLISTCPRLDRILWRSESDAMKHWTWRRYLAHAPFFSQVTQFLETLPYMEPGNEPVVVPIWALQLPIHNLQMKDQFSDGDLMMDHLEKHLRNPAGVKDLPPLDAFLKRVDGTWALYCPNRKRLLVLRCVQAVHVNMVLKVRCEVRGCLGDKIQPNWPSLDFFQGEWEDHKERTVTVWQTATSCLTVQMQKSGEEDRRFSIKVDEFGRWMCGKGVLQACTSTENKISWVVEDLSQKWTWWRSFYQEAQGPTSVPVSETQTRSVQLAWPDSVAFFLGTWVNNHGNHVRVEWKGDQSGSVVAQIRRWRCKPLNIDGEGRWTCGEGVLQPHQSSHNKIVWLSDENTPRQWTWQRSTDSDEYLPYAPFMPEVTRFCDKDAPRMTPSKEPVQTILVPVWAMRFTQYNINENLRFSDRRRRRMFDLLQELLIDPAAVSNLEPLDVFLYQGPDGKQALYCINNRRLLVLRCLQAVRSEMLIKVKCCVHDIHSTARVPHGTGTGRFCDWFKSGYSKPGQFAGCDGLGLCIWVRDRR